MDQSPTGSATAFALRHLLVAPNDALVTAFRAAAGNGFRPVRAAAGAQMTVA
jgi:hypothetical protein